MNEVKFDEYMCVINYYSWFLFSCEKWKVNKKVFLTLINY